MLLLHVSSKPILCVVNVCRFIPTAYYYPDAALTPASVNSDYFPAMWVAPISILRALSCCVHGHPQVKLLAVASMCNLSPRSPHPIATLWRWGTACVGLPVARCGGVVVVCFVRCQPVRPLYFASFRAHSCACVSPVMYPMYPGFCELPPPPLSATRSTLTPGSGTGRASPFGRPSGPRECAALPASAPCTGA